MSPGQISLDTLYMQQGQETKRCAEIDVQDRAEAIKNALGNIGEENFNVLLIREGNSNSSENAVSLAAPSGAIIIGFNVTADRTNVRLAM